MTTTTNAIDAPLPISVGNGGTSSTTLNGAISQLFPPQGVCKNMIIGGDFNTNPWAGGVRFTNVTTGRFLADRWQMNIAGASSLGRVYYKNHEGFGGLQPTTPSGWGEETASFVFKNSTAVPSLTNNTVLYLKTNIEGIRWAQFAQVPLVLSFWVYAAHTGTYSGILGNLDGGAGGRQLSFEYTVNVANTWQYVSINIPPSPASGTWFYDYDTIGLTVSFCLAVGTGLYKFGPILEWNNNLGFGTPSQTNALQSIADPAWKIAYIQIERGTSPTNFQKRTAEHERYLCQRFRQSTSYGQFNLFPIAQANVFTNMVGGSTAVIQQGGVPNAFLYIPYKTQMTRLPNPVTQLIFTDDNAVQGHVLSYPLAGTAVASKAALATTLPDGNLFNFLYSQNGFIVYVPNSTDTYMQLNYIVQTGF